MPEPTKMAMRRAFTLPSKYLFKLGMEPWKPKAVKNTGLAEIMRALSIGMAMRLSNLMAGNMSANTTMNVAIMVKNSKRLILSTLCVPMTIKAPKKTVKINTAVLPVVSSSIIVGRVSANNEPPPLI